ncbi:hypothetical protein I6F35_18580 [Bradyrhizobium sp. BRP22]|uniref:hypothetical protein n=1 Tax=Bradyrhizobium sp. BRP22 TaxID=2793821 RepID=UPI001CD1F893|nr:hypothetical protein [Bradyrhizobium sp. BRP22]MCA1455199.1 hypothetical protein [Bradyrhizobium sp. BRP22]
MNEAFCLSPRDNFAFNWLLINGTPNCTLQQMLKQLAGSAAASKPAETIQWLIPACRCTRAVRLLE